MKLRETDPPRLGDDEASELGRLVRLSGNQRMSPKTASHLARRLEAAGAFGAAARASALGPRHLLGHVRGAKLVALVGVGGALLAWQMWTSEAPLQPVVMTTVASPSVVTAPPPTPTIEAPAVAVEALPSSPTPAVIASSSARPVAPRASAPAPVSTNREPTATADVEFALIRSAQAALASDPSRALALAEEHARTFPAGELVQERELTAVEALARLGRRAEAEDRAHALLTRFPRTPYVARLERALGEALSPGLPSSKTAR